MADLWQGVGTRGGVVERTAATDGTWDYISGPGGGIQLNGPSTSGDIIEYQSCEKAAVSRPFADLASFTVNVDFASNIAIPQPPPGPTVNAVMGKFVWRFGFISSARLTDPPEGVYFEKTAGTTAADATWYIVARDGTGEERQPVDYILPGEVTLSIRRFYIQGLFDRVMTRGTQTTKYLDTHIPTGPMNLFMQVIPSDVSIDSHFQCYSYGVGGPLYGGTNVHLPEWVNAPIGKLGWLCTSRDYYGFTCANQSGASFGSSTPYQNHPGILTLQAAPSNIYQIVPDGGGGVIDSETGTASCLFIPYGDATRSNMSLGGYYSAGVGHWRQRFIVHLGDGDFDWAPQAFSYEAVIGLALRQDIPSGSNQFPGDCYFYVYSIVDESPATGHWRFYNQLFSGSEDIDTGIVAADVNGVQPARWFMLELEKWPNRNQIRARIYSANRDGKDRVLWEHYTPYDGTIFDVDTLGPFYTSFNGGGTSTSLGARLLIDAHGLAHELAATASA